MSGSSRFDAPSARRRVALRARRGAVTPASTAAAVAAAAIACPAGAYVLEGQMWADQNTATPATIDIFYDFRNITLNGTTYQNDLTLNNATAAAERAEFVQTLNDYSVITGGKIVFSQQTTGNNVINLGLGDMAAVGAASGQTGVFGLGGGTFGADNKYVSAFAWLNHAYTFDTTIGNGNVAGFDADFYSIALHEVGHALGLGHSESSPANIMTAVDEGEKLRPSVDDDNGIRAIYGTNHPANPSVDDTAVTRTISGNLIMGNNGFYNFFVSDAASFRYYVDTGTTTVQGSTQINFGGFEQQGGNWTHNSIQIGDPSNSIWSGSPYYKLSGGTLVVNNAVTVGGGAEGGSFLQSGGTATLGSLTIGNGSIAGTATISGGSLTINGATTLNSKGKLNVTGGTVVAHALTGSGTVTIGGGGGTTSLSVSSLALSSTLIISNNGTVAIRPATNRITNTLTGLSISGNGTLDIGNHDLVLNGTYATVDALVKQAAGAHQGTQGLNPWTGSGITSSLVKSDAAAGHTNQAAIGYKDNADYLASGNSGKAVAAGKVLVSYVPYGDANLDNIVDIADLSIWNNNFGTGNHWGQGDFNYDGVVDIADLSIWNNNFGGKVSPSSAGFGDISDLTFQYLTLLDAVGNDQSNVTTGVPEPASLGLLALAGLVVLRRGRRLA